MRHSGTRLAPLWALALALPLGAQEPASNKQPPIPADKDPQTTPSGLRYSILVPGDPAGIHPKTRDKVSCQYTGWLESGLPFDSSRVRGAPMTFRIGQVIPGWSEALCLMTPGATWKLVIPSKLAYADRGIPGLIPPNATLIFEMELLSVEAAPPAPELHPLAAERTQTAPSGLKYEVVEAGAGEPPGVDDAFVLSFAFWNSEGKLLDCTANSDAFFFGTSKQVLVGDPKAAPGPHGGPSPVDLALLRQVPGLMREGARVRFEVPPALLFGDQARGPDLPANSTTQWEFTMTKVTRVPTFSLSPADKLKTTASGLQYEVLREGTGKTPAMGKNVTVNYAGWLTDGTSFDSSYSRGAPATFRLGEVIPGWNEGLQLMKVGGTYKFTIPAALAYGATARGPIPANSTLVFVVELLETE